MTFLAGKHDEVRRKIVPTRPQSPPRQGPPSKAHSPNPQRRDPPSEWLPPLERPLSRYQVVGDKNRRAGELCIDEKKLYRILSNSKQSVGGESNRDWWRKWVIWGFYHYWCKPNFQVTKFYLLVHDIVSPIVLTSRVRKAVGFTSDLSVTEVDSPQYPSTSEGHHAFINKHYKPTNT